MGTYSPKIAEDLIQRLYAMKVEAGTSMTQIVDQILRENIPAYEAKLGIITEPEKKSPSSGKA